MSTFSSSLDVQKSFLISSSNVITASTMPKTGVLAEPVLVGRKKELEELQSFLNSAVEGKGKTVFISGEAGSGKTRLTREFLNSAIKQGIAVMAGWCLSDSQAPYFPFVEAFTLTSRLQETRNSLLI